MSEERWIIVRNWERFQHYKDRDPYFIKLYTELQHDHNWLALTGHQRAVLVGIWLEYASARCQLPLNTASLTRRLALRVSSATLKALNHAGFIEFSSRAALEIARSQEVEAEIERETEREVKGSTVRRRAREHDVEKLIDELEQLEARWPPWNSTS
jgi:hypothetical protein